MPAKRRKKKPVRFGDTSEDDVDVDGADADAEADDVHEHENNSKQDQDTPSTVDEKLDALLQGQRDMRNSLDTYKVEVSAMMSQFDQRIIAVETLVHTSMNEVTNNSLSISALGATVSELKESCEFVSGKIDDYEKKVKGYDAFIAKHNETLKQNDILKKQINDIGKMVNSEKRIRVNDQQYSNNNKLEINGIPFINGQHSLNDCCKQLVVDVATLAGVEMVLTDVDVAHRLPNSNTTIIVQFTSRTARNRLWYGKTGLKGKTVQDIRLPKPEGNAGYIFINEQLCPYNKYLLKEVKLQTDYLGIARRCVFTRKGAIFVKAPHYNDGPLAIKYLDDIGKIY